MMLNTNRQISNHSHPTMEVGHENALAPVEVAASVLRADVCVTSPRCRPMNASALPSPIQVIEAVADVAKIAQAVVRFVVVDVVNKLRLLAVSQEPRNPVGVVVSALMTDHDVAVSIFRANGPVQPLAENQSGVGVIGEKIVNRIRNGFNASSHVESPLNVVRGLVTAITSTPILSRGVAA